MAFSSITGGDIYKEGTDEWILKRSRLGVPFCDAPLHPRQVCADSTRGVVMEWWPYAGERAMGQGWGWEIGGSQVPVVKY